MSIEQEIQKLQPDSMIELFQLDLTSLNNDNELILYYTNNKMDTGNNPIFDGKEYTAIPIEMNGFKNDTTGALPTPEVSIANVNSLGQGGLFTDLLQTYNEFIGAKVTRIRTFAKYLDNFGITADSSATLPIDIYIVAQLVRHDSDVISFILRNPLDDENRDLPGEDCTRTCLHSYRLWNGSAFEQGTCPYTASGNNAYYNRVGERVNNPQDDDCGKRITDCDIRFRVGDNNPDPILPFRGFPGVGK